MKLSCSTRGWEDGSWKEWIDAAVEMDFGGVEIRDAQRMEALFERSGPFHKYNLSATVREMREKNLEIPCLDSSCNLADPASSDELKPLIRLAAELRVPYVGA